ncbi:hypothetical protein GLOIN_2v1778669 [Rhizophagus irregularis DAOM 181602=DAOM 197198]|nr:hypothetical protein GLOIN_2v1778669 [Rhizophagus irregularis DAOM 181602=DAOM 197198]
MRLIKHQIFYFPEANTRLESLYTKPNHGIVKLIEVQKNLKYFEWKDDFDDDYLKEDPYDIFLHALEKKADSIDHLRIFFRIVFNIEHTLLQNILPKFHKLKTLLIDDYLLFNEEQLKNLVYHDLEILNIEFNKLNVISSIIENGGGRLKKILFRPYDTIDFEFNDNFNESSLNFIQKWRGCPLSILTSDSIYESEDYKKLIDKYKNDGIIKDFRYESYTHLINYHISHNV